MYNVLGDAGSGSSTPAAYQPPYFDVDAYSRPSAPRYGQSQRLSQIREDFPDEPNPEGGRGGGSSRGRAFDAVEEEEEAAEEEEDIGRHPYSRKDTMTLFNAWVSVSYDPIVGNQQTRKYFWEKVTDAYNEKKSSLSRRRTMKMLRSHFDRVDRDVKKFCGIYKNEAGQYQSGASGVENMRATMRVLFYDNDKEFKHVDVWEAVKDVER